MYVHCSYRVLRCSVRDTASVCTPGSLHKRIFLATLFCTTGLLSACSRGERRGEVREQGVRVRMGVKVKVRLE